MVSDLAYEIDLPAGSRIHPVISVVHLEQYHEDSFGREPPAPPGPVLSEGQEEWVVEKLLRSDGDQIEVKWKGYGETTWEPRDRLNEDVPEMVRAFETRRRPGRPRKNGL